MVVIPSSKAYEPPKENETSEPIDGQEMPEASTENQTDNSSTPIEVSN